MGGRSQVISKVVSVNGATSRLGGGSGGPGMEWEGREVSKLCIFKRILMCTCK